MLPELPGVPPAIPLLLSEVGIAKSGNGRKRLKGLLKELAVQSESYLNAEANTMLASQNTSMFRIHMHGALDLFTGDGCSELPCRLEATNRLARSVALIADEIWLTDTFSTNFLNFGRATNEKLDAIICNSYDLI